MAIAYGPLGSPREDLLALVRATLESPGLMPASHKRALRALEVLTVALPDDGSYSKALSILRGDR